MTKQLLKFSYALSIFIMVVVLVASYIVINKSIASKKYDSTIINIAGKQRMLSQRITQLSIRYVTENDSLNKKVIRTELVNSLSKWQQAHQALQFGDSNLEINKIEQNDEIRLLYFQIQPSYSSILTACNSLLNTLDKKEISLQIIIQKQDVFLSIMDKIVKAYERNSNEKLYKIQQLESILFAIALLVIVLECLFIFKPTIQKVSQYVQSLKQLDDKLKERELLFKNAFTHATIGMCIADINGKLLQVNESICNTLGYAITELLATNLQLYVVQEDLENDYELFEELKAGSRKNYTVEKRFLHKTGKTIWTLLSVSLINNLKDNSQQIVTQLENISATKEAEILLKSEKKLLRTIIDNLPINVYVKDTLSRKTLVNKAELLHMGVTNEEAILGKSDVELYPLESAMASIEEDQLVIEKGEAIIDKETFNFKKDGTENWFLTSKIPLKNEENKIIGLLGISHNITERKTIEHQLTVALNNFQNVLNATHQVSIIGTDIFGTITIFNTGAEQLLGYTAEEVINKNSPIIFHKLEEVEQRAVELTNELGRTISGFEIFIAFAKNKEFESKEWTYTRKDGSTFPVQLIITSLKDITGEITGYLGVAIDISTLKHSQIALKQSELQFRALFELSPVGIALNDYVTGNFLDANHSLLNTIGYNKNQLQEKNFWNIMPSRYKILKINILKSLRENGLYGPVESEYIKKDKSTYPVLLNGVQIKDASGRILLWSVIQNISEIKQKEKQLSTLNTQVEKRNADLQISNKELEQFAYVASHDLQEPLRMISGFLTKLEKKYKNELDETALQYINFAVDGAARMRNLITDLLAYSRAGKVEYQTEEVSINTILLNVVSLLNNHVDETKSEIKWGEMPTIKCAKTPIQQLFLNLISNSLKYQKENTTPQINIDAKELDKHWQFAITDNGIGIESEYYDKIFTIFQRLHNKEKFSGTGIGLAICKKIVTYHNGEIWVQSIPNLGTTFFFTLSKEIS